METTKPFQLGSISTGCTLPKDLILKFQATFEAITGNASIPIPEEMMREDGRYTDGNVLAMLVANLEALCPPFVTFGAHPGDEADFGFWPDWDALNEHCSKTIDGVGSEHIVKFRNGNFTIMDLDHNILWSAD